mmetsp:Transcript_33711/g.71619  ORF Transcript_33711/g.71619 Transcript_33711/m.71619 type:complete len:303 (+) Transcript_33711:1074-1982(+)
MAFRTFCLETTGDRGQCFVHFMRQVVTQGSCMHSTGAMHGAFQCSLGKSLGMAPISCKATSSGRLCRGLDGSVPGGVRANRGLLHGRGQPQHRLARCAQSRGGRRFLSCLSLGFVALRLDFAGPVGSFLCRERCGSRSQRGFGRLLMQALHLLQSLDYPSFRCSLCFCLGLGRGPLCGRGFFHGSSALGLRRIPGCSFGIRLGRRGLWRWRSAGRGTRPVSPAGTLFLGSSRLRRWRRWWGRLRCWLRGALLRRRWWSDATLPVLGNLCICILQLLEGRSIATLVRVVPQAQLSISALDLLV